MKWSQRVRLLLRAALDDLFGEGSEDESGRLPRPAKILGRGEDRLAGMLEDAQRRLEALQVELANAIGRQKRIELQWQEAVSQANRLDQAVDSALQAKQEDEARDLLDQARHSQTRAKELGELYQACKQLTSEIQEAIQAQQEQLQDMQRKYMALTEREMDAEVLEDLARLQREMSRQATGLQAELEKREEQVARREDRIAARFEVDRYKGS